MKIYSNLSAPAKRTSVADVRRWRDDSWEKSRKRETIEYGPGLVYVPLPATWLYWFGVSCVNRLDERTLNHTEEAFRATLYRVARDTGLHLCSHYTVAATRDARPHLHATLGLDPMHTWQALSSRRPLVAPVERSLTIRHKKAFEPLEEPVMQYLGDTLAAEYEARGLSVQNGGLFIDPYVEKGFISGGISAEWDERLQRDVFAARDLDGNRYIRDQKSFGGVEPREGFALFCPAGHSRLRSCRRGRCALGFPDAARRL